MPNNYDPVARYYDLLTQLVFGQTEIDAQVGLLRFVEAGSRLLIVGGGTGWILEKIEALCPPGLLITYVEPSAVMMALARKRKWGGNRVSFVPLPVERFVTDERFDCILTGFLFDNFRQEKAAQVVRELDGLLVGGGHWLFADLYYSPKVGPWWQGWLLRSMYWSARLICGVEANRLPDMEGVFGAVGYAVVCTSVYYRGFIRSVVYRKSRF
jgi:ubiquinone/menaquinone biosynthesis C-methylase UbiE